VEDPQGTWIRRKSRIKHRRRKLADFLPLIVVALLLLAALLYFIYYSVAPPIHEILPPNVPDSAASSANSVDFK